MVVISYKNPSAGDSSNPAVGRRMILPGRIKDGKLRIFLDTGSRDYNFINPSQASSLGLPITDLIPPIEVEGFGEHHFSITKVCHGVEVILDGVVDRPNRLELMIGDNHNDDHEIDGHSRTLKAAYMDASGGGSLTKRVACSSLPRVNIVLVGYLKDRLERQVIAMFDTGSNCSFISPSTVEEFGLKPISIKSFESTGFSGKGGVVSQMCQVDWSFDDMGFSFDLNISNLGLKGQMDMLIGVDWMYYYSPIYFDLVQVKVGILYDGQLRFIQGAVTKPHPSYNTYVQSILDNPLFHQSIGDHSNKSNKRKKESTSIKRLEVSKKQKKIH
ncbi:OLC1v1033854C2 [Oldenlandia corymbosa var. corymbosa]|uniref:OLC1v1033854C2 n=1 Tax=Oldenlandia corymbosa var. corymbosa TaxID=529605 RepID=A0AAV1CPW0_OLDCO|nr:OLC1v1033854C2 [Oldenlandia corymbosa var. corymbosa]